MHQSSFDLMGKLLEKVAVRFDPNQVVDALDCGSALADTGLQKTYRELVECYGFSYRGMDAQSGRNVDLVCDIYKLRECLDLFAPASTMLFDLVISGQMLEHLAFPLAAVQEMKKVVTPGGWIILIAPWEYGIHRYPIDCWRVLPDGMEFLLEGFVQVQSGVVGEDCWGLGRKPESYKTPWEIRRA
jgi:SAM-dependent methyltransferase